MKEKEESMSERRARLEYSWRWDSYFNYGITGFLFTIFMGYGSLLVILVATIINLARKKRGYYLIGSIISFVLGGAIFLAMRYLRLKYGW